MDARRWRWPLWLALSAAVLALAWLMLPACGISLAGWTFGACVASSTAGAARDIRLGHLDAEIRLLESRLILASAACGRQRGGQGTDSAPASPDLPGNIAGLPRRGAPPSAPGSAQARADAATRADAGAGAGNNAGRRSAGPGPTTCPCPLAGPCPDTLPARGHRTVARRRAGGRHSARTTDK
ncbi:hypothetical protein [Methylobrevis pamukkalensis]|uniref:hypothetical protein n=1 Tax=Methylobrevis pamukkalensis TaxID=1439726 RepID=UPI000845C275|nr:hypothetical protein [Methylobrevis pamukkalensis]